MVSCDGGEERRRGVEVVGFRVECERGGRVRECEGTRRGAYAVGTERRGG